jgi:hypothetical protein
MPTTNTTDVIDQVVADQGLTADQQQLVEDNQGLAFSLANRFRSAVERDDKHQDALLGLCQAAKNFKGTAADSQDFCRFAGAWIIGQLLKGHTKRESCRLGDRAGLESILLDAVASEAWIRRRSDWANQVRVRLTAITREARSRCA